MSASGVASTPSPNASASRAAAWPVAGVLVAALALRLWHLGHGLPDFLEEAIPLRLAIALTDPATGRVDWNPHDFHYPSLSIYAHFAVQWLRQVVESFAGPPRNSADHLLRYLADPSAAVLAARALGVACDLAAILGVIRIADRLARGSGWLAGAMAAVAPTLILTSRSVFCDSLMAAFGVWALERTIAGAASNRTRDFTWAAVLTGLAAGAKYPAAVLLVPLAWTLVRARGAAAPGTWAALALVAAATFAATTPFALLRPDEFLRDFRFESGHAAAGHLGSLGHLSFGFHVTNLAANLGWIGLIPLAGAAFVPGRTRARTTTTVAILFALAGFLVPISLARIDADRYVVPVVFCAVPLVAATATRWASRLAAWPRFGEPAARWAPALLLLPVAVLGIPAAASGGRTTQGDARAWCGERLRPDDLIVLEGYTASLPGAREKRELQAGAAYAHAGPAGRSAVDSIRTFHVVSIPLRVAGNVAVPVTRPGGSPAPVEVLPHAGALNRVYYDPRLYAGADYLMTSSAVRDRYAADPGRYPVECRFYETLDRDAEAVATFRPEAGRGGPEIRVYRLGARFAARVAAAGPLPADWWLAAIPPEAKARVADAAATHDSAAVAGLLAPVYRSRIQPLVSELAAETVRLGRVRVAHDLAAATRAAVPDDAEAAFVQAVAASRLGNWRETEGIATREMQRDPTSEFAMPFGLLRARAMLSLGRRAEAVRAFDALIASSPPGSPFGAEVHRWRDRAAQPSR